MLLNEGAGPVFEFDGRRRFGVACAEKGIFRFNLDASGEAGHASVPQLGDNALLKLAPALTALADRTAQLHGHRGARRAAVGARARPRRRRRARSTRSATIAGAAAC